MSLTSTNFEKSEFACRETGDNFMQAQFLEKLYMLRALCDFPFTITSGYRSPLHSVEQKKAVPGIHTEGLAADIACDSTQAYIIMKNAFLLGFTGIARGKGFVHVDLRPTTPKVWVY